MTVLLVLIFLCLALFADFIVEWRKIAAPNRARAPDLYVHNNGLLPTMADGGEKIADKPEDQA
jgi:NADH:ubiquinone oxidoreductase subunit H